MQRTNPDNDDTTLCTCGRPAAGIDARTQSPSCRQCANDNPRIVTDGGSPETPDVGIQHDMSSLPDGFSDLTDEQQSVMAGGFSRSNLIGLIRERIGSETSSKTDRLLKSELIDLLVILEEGE